MAQPGDGPRRLTRADSQDLSDFQGLQLSTGDGHELYRALRGSQGDDPLEDELLWEGDYMSTQREFIQKRQEEALLQRLERRIGVGHPAPRPASASAPGTSTAPSLGAVALAAAGGLRIKKLVGDIAGALGGGRAGAQPSAAAAAGDASAAGTASASIAGPGARPSSAGVATVSKSEGQGAQHQAHQRPASSSAGWSAAAPKQLAALRIAAGTPHAATVASSPRAPAHTILDEGEEEGESQQPRPQPRRVTKDIAAALAAAAAAASGGDLELVALTPPRPGTSGDGASSQQGTPRGTKGVSGPPTPRLGLLTAEPPAVAGPAAEPAAPGGSILASASIKVPKATTAASASVKDSEAHAPPSRAGTEQLLADMEQYGPLRRTVLQVSTHPDFELGVILLIFANCITLAMYRPLEGEDSTWNKGLQTADTVLNIIFTVEMLTRIVSMGGILPYLSQPWNVFDSIMVAAGYTTFIPMGASGSAGAGLEGVRALRALRALRPLRTITRFQSLRSIVVCFLEAIPLIMSVLGMLFFFLFIFGVTGTELFAGMYHTVCVDAAGNFEQSESYQGEMGCGSRDCPDGYTCQMMDVGTSVNTAGFGNVALAFLTVFQCMTLSGWTYVMYRSMDSVGGYSVVYFVLLVILGAYFVLNLFLAVLKSKFAKAQSLLIERHKHSTTRERVNSISKLVNLAKRRWSTFVSSQSEKEGVTKHLANVAQASGSNTINMTPRSGVTLFFNVGTGSNPPTGAVTPPAGAEAGAGAGAGVGASSLSAATRTAAGSGTNSMGPVGVQSVRPVDHVSGVAVNPGGDSMKEYGRTHTQDSGLSGGMSGVHHLPRSGSVGSAMTGLSGGSGTTSRYSTKVVLISAEEFDMTLEGVEMPAAKRQWLRFQYRVRLMVESSTFNNIFVLAIVANTIILAVEYDNMPHKLELALADANLAFTVIFCCELVVKVLGLGLWTYIGDYWNMFDGAVVAFSLLELGLTTGSGLSALRSLRSLRVLKSFRVLRVVKMFRYMDSLQQIAKVLITSMDSFAAIVVLLMLFWLVFSIVGLHVFGGLDLAPPGWPNCDSLINSLILNFHTLNLENFEITMFMIVRASNYGAAAYYMAWIVLGKFILLALFLAVMLEAFESKYQVQPAKGGGILSRLRNAGRRIATASTAFRSGGSHSGRSVLSMFGRRTTGEKTMKGGPGSVSRSGPVGEAVEDLTEGNRSAGAASEVGHNAQAALSPCHSVPTWRVGWCRWGRRVPFKEQEGRPVTDEDVVLQGGAQQAWDARARLRHRRAAALQHSGSMRTAQLNHCSVNKLACMALGAPAPPFVFPEIWEGTTSTGEESLWLAPSTDPEPCTAQGSTAFTVPPPPGAGTAATGESAEEREQQALASHHRQLVELLVAQSELRAKQDERLMERADALSPKLAPWRSWTRDASQHSQHAAEGGRDHPGSRWSSASSGRGDRSFDCDGGAGGVGQEDGTYSWTEFFETLQLIGLGTTGKVSPGPQAAIAMASTAPRAANPGGPVHTGQGPVGEGTEAAASATGRAKEVGGRLSFSSGLASLIAEAEQITGETGSSGVVGGDAGDTVVQGEIEHGLLSPGITFRADTTPGLRPHPPQSPPAGTKRPERLQLGRASEVKVPAGTGAGDFGVPGGGAANSSWAASAKEPVTPHIHWQTLENESDDSIKLPLDPAASRRTIGALANATAPAVAGAPRPPISHVDVHKSPRAGRVSFLTESMKRNREDDGSFLEMVLASLGGASTSGSGLRKGASDGGAADSRVGSLCGAHPAGAKVSWGLAGNAACGATGDGSASGAARAADLGYLISSGDELLSTAMREPSITVKALKRKKEALVLAGIEAGSLRASPLPGEAPGAEGAAPLPGDASALGLLKGGLPRSQSSASGSVHSEGAGSHISSGTGISGRRSATYTDYGTASHRTDVSGAPPPLAGKSLWLLPEDNLVRLWLYDFVTSKWFDYAMTLLILLNCIAMAYEHPHMHPGAIDTQVLYWSDVGFTTAFGLEAAFKILAFTFKGYFAVGTNKVDLIIVVTSAMLLGLDNAQIQAIRALRVLRAAKPLRALTRSAGMRLVFKSVTMSLAAMANVSLVVVLFFLIFAILGVQLFSGKFWSCNDTNVPDRDSCVGMFTDPDTGQSTARAWANPEFNFDHLGTALISLFVVATLNGYSEIMNAAMAAPEEKHLQPQPMNNWSVFFFFVAFVVVVSYTLLNLYIGVVFFQFSRIRQQSQTGSAFLTTEQQEWAELSKMVFRLKPPEKCPVPRNKIRRNLYYMVHSHTFEACVMVLIITNALLMATTYYGEGDAMVNAVESINYAFTCVFILEAIIKVVGLGWPNYWKIGWNRFDLLLVASSLADMLVSLVGGEVVNALKIQKVMRLLRLARVVKLVRGMKGIRSLFGTLIVSLPAFWNVGALLGLLFYIYAYIGTLLLGKIKHNGGLNDHANFDRFWMSLLTLFRVATNDNWTDIFIGCMVRPPDCDPSLDECGTWVAIPYFLSFVLLVSIVMLNLFTAVIIENFEKQQEQEAWRLNPHTLEEFVELWSEYDDGSGSIDPRDLEAMLLRLHPPMGLGPGAEGKDVLRFVFDLDIPLVQGRVPFHRTAFELVKRCSGTQIPAGLLKDQIDRLVARNFKNMRSDEVLNFSVAVTVMRVQRKWRARMRAAKLKRKKETRADRAVVPQYADAVAARDTLLRKAISSRQEGNWRWCPTEYHAPLWDDVEAVMADERAAEEAAAAEVAAAAALAAAAAASSAAPVLGGGGGLRRLLGARTGRISIRRDKVLQDEHDRDGAGAAPGGGMGAAFRRIAQYFGSSASAGASVAPAPQR